MVLLLVVLLLSLGLCLWLLLLLCLLLLLLLLLIVALTVLVLAVDCQLSVVDCLCVIVCNVSNTILYLVYLLCDCLSYWTWLAQWCLSEQYSHIDWAEQFAKEDFLCVQAVCQQIHITQTIKQILLISCLHTILGIWHSSNFEGSPWFVAAQQTMP